VGHRDRSGDHTGAYRSSFFIQGSPEETAHFAALRQRLGDEAVDRMLRSRELRRHPRPLTDAERSVLDAAMAPVLRDLRAVGAIVPEVRYEALEDRGPDCVCALIGPAGQSLGSQGIWVAAGSSPAEQVAGLAEQVQEWEVEALAAAGMPATWPECPEHPDSHPLQPVVSHDGRASWRCPRRGLTVGAIGELGACGGRGSR
jgi:hypothetical protein